MWPSAALFPPPHLVTTTSVGACACVCVTPVITYIMIEMCALSACVCSFNSMLLPYFHVRVRGSGGGGGGGFFMGRGGAGVSRQGGRGWA